MKQSWSDAKFVWLLAGVLFGLGIAYLWPAESAYAQAVEGNDKFAMATVPTLVGSGDAVFVLDMLTGRLIGASYSPQARGFNQTYFRLVAADFGVTERGQYSIVPGRIILTATATGAGSPAQGVLYVGEMTTGTICAYGFSFVQGPRQIPIQDLVLLAKFPFRQASN